MKTIGILTALSALIAGPASAQSTIWQQNGHAYEVVDLLSDISWTSASAAAHAKGGHLATITSLAENDFIWSLMLLHPNPGWFNEAWIGGLQVPGSQEPDQGWGWVTGEPFTYTNWTPGEPNNTGFPPEDFLQIGAQYGTYPTWNDLSDGGSQMKAYVIEYETEPPTTPPITTTPEPTTLSCIAIGLGALGVCRRRRKGSLCQ